MNADQSAHAAGGTAGSAACKGVVRPHAPSATFGHYAAAVGLVAAAIILTLGFWQPVFSRNPFALLLAAVIVAAWYGGLWPGLLATVLSVWGYGYFIVPSFLTLHHALNWVATVGVFTFIAVLISTLDSLRSRAMRHLQLAKESAEADRAAADQARTLADKARAAAEAASRAKDEFLAVLSHELRTPLTPALVATAALAIDPNLPPDAREDLAMVRRNIELEARLIDDLLDFTRVSNGKLQLRRETVDIHSLINHVVAICSNDARAKRLDLQLELNCPRPHAYADPARINQVLWNLVKNAIKFTPERGRVTIRTRQAVSSDDRGNAADQAGGQIVVEVEDTGLGIDQDVLPRVFDAFEQGEHANSHRFGGLGLGLAISKALAVAHGGELTATSAGAGRGATFALRLGLTADTPAVALPAPVVGLAGGEAQNASAIRPLRVLLVEDHEDTSRIVGRLLRSLGYEVRSAGGVAEGLTASREQPFDLLVSDLGLPDGSGLDLMRQLRAQFGFDTPPAIALSGYGMDQDLRKSREAGFAAHLTKPIHFAELEAKIRELTRGNPVTASA